MTPPNCGCWQVLLSPLLFCSACRQLVRRIKVACHLSEVGRCCCQHFSSCSSGSMLSTLCDLWSQLVVICLRYSGWQVLLSALIFLLSLQHIVNPV